jgi:hypothetical protein
MFHGRAPTLMVSTTRLEPTSITLTEAPRPFETYTRSPRGWIATPLGKLTGRNPRPHPA